MPVSPPSTMCPRWPAARKPGKISTVIESERTSWNPKTLRKRKIHSPQPRTQARIHRLTRHHRRRKPRPQATLPAVPTIHYNLSYSVRNEAQGPRGAIVLLHDLPGGAFTWADALPRLAGTGRAVYAFDLLGYGQSDRPWPSDTSIWGHADNLSYAFKRLGLRDIVLVGVGLGGAVAQVLATRLYREETARLVLINSYAYQYAYAPDWPLPEMEKRRDPEAPMHTPTDQMIADLRKTLPLAVANAQYLAGSKLSAYLD